MRFFAVCGEDRYKKTAVHTDSRTAVLLVFILYTLHYSASIMALNAVSNASFIAFAASAVAAVVV